MLIGVIALVIGFLNGGGPVVIVGLVIIGLGVLEVTAREHFTGYRSHSTLLAAIPRSRSRRAWWRCSGHRASGRC